LPTGGASFLAETLTNYELKLLIYVVGAVLLSTFVSVSLFVAVARSPRTWKKEERSWLDYGNLFIVAFGIAAVIVGFLVLLLFIRPLPDGRGALAFLAALFGVVTGLVGTYFGVKQSADAREGAHDMVRRSRGVGNTTPIITIEPLTDTKEVHAKHEVTARVTSVDKSPAGNTPVTFTVTKGPDRDVKEKKKNTDEHGSAKWSFTNNGKEGQDTIEARALGSSGRATVEFRESRKGTQEQQQAARQAETRQQQEDKGGEEQRAHREQEKKATHIKQEQARKIRRITAQHARAQRHGQK